MRHSPRLLVLLLLASAGRTEAQGWSQSDDACDPLRDYVEWAIDQDLDRELPPLLFFRCESCAANELPEIVVSEETTGLVRPGHVEWVRDEHGVHVPFVRWIAEEALAAGLYRALVTLPEGLEELESNPWPFGVGRGPVPHAELVLELEATLYSKASYTGTSFVEVCGHSADPCGGVPLGTRTAPSVSLRATGRGDYDGGGNLVSGAYAYRLSVYADDELALDGAWGNLVPANDGIAHFFITRAAALRAQRLCVEVEALRVTDGTLSKQPRECVANPAFGRASRPAPYVELSAAERASCTGADGGAGDAWLTAWCDDNFLECAERTPGSDDACAGYLERCEGYEAPLTTSSGSASTRDGGMRTAPRAGSARDGGCGCRIAQSYDGDAPVVWLLAGLGTMAARSALRARARRRA